MDRPIRILHLIEALGLGGAERRLSADLRHLSEDPRFLNHVCILYNDTALAPELEAANVRVSRLGMRGIYDAWKGVWQLRSVLREVKPDILHTQLFGADLYGRILGRLSGCRVVSTFQSSVHEPTNPYLFSRKRRALDRLTSHLVDRFVAVSEFVKASIVKQLGIAPEKIDVIHNYVDFESFSKVDSARVSSLRQAFGFKEETKVLLTVGRLDPPKGHAYLLEAFKEILQENRDVRLLVVGEGPAESSLRRLADDFRLNGSVFFLGLRKDVPELLGLSDIFVLPTLSEGFPMTLLEAVAFRKPCIASRVGPILEVLEDGVTGLLTDPASARQIADAIRLCLRDAEEARRIGERAYDRARQKFDTLMAIGKLKRFYERVMDG